MRTLAAFIVMGSFALGQDKAPVTQQGGACSANVSGNDNTVSLTCTGLSPKMAEQIRTLLNSARRSEAAQKEIGEKLDQILKQTNRETIPPTVGLRFVYPESPSLVIANPSAGIARDIKYTVALWNMDLPDRNDPLPIPIASFDWIRPNDEGGPQNLFGSPQVATLLKHGDHLFGSAAVICPECTRGRTYIVYIVWGQSGWYSEIENELSGRVFTPQNFLRPARETYFKQLETMAPSQTRIPIGNP